LGQQGLGIQVDRSNTTRYLLIHTVDLPGVMLFSMTRARTKLLIVVALFVIGVAIRLYFLGMGRSLWLDEAMLSLNIVERSMLDLFQPLGYKQAAPLGFLISEKAAIMIFGNSDYILRLFPFLFGAGSVLLIYPVARKYSAGWAPIIALLLLAVTPSAIYYSAEVKQYSSEIFTTLVLIYFAPRLLNRDVSRAEMLGFGLVAATAQWFSLSSLFVTAGIYLTLGLHYLKSKDWKKVFLFGASALIWLVNLLFLYFISFRFLTDNKALASYWNAFFAPMPSSESLGWYHNALFEFLRYPADFPPSLLTAALMLIGLVSFGLRKWELLLFLTMPILLALIASGLKKYPFEGRLLLFLLPYAIFMVAEGVERIRVLFAEKHEAVAAAAALALVAYLSLFEIDEKVERLHHLSTREHIKPLMKRIAENRRKSDQIYIYYGAAPAFKYYSARFGFSDDDYLRGRSHRKHPEKYAEDLARITHSGRVWMLFTHKCPSCEVNEEELIVERMKRHYERAVLAEKQNDASLYLFEYANNSKRAGD
jgi:hypothetical protein